MKKTISIVLLLLVTVGMYAQEGINYKALIKDNLGAVVASQTIDVKFTIIADTGPTDVYAETHTSILTDANGIVILTIGGGRADSGVFADIAWVSDLHSLKVEIDIEQDASFVDMGTTQFMAVPYSLQATTATTATELPGGIDQAYIENLQSQITALEGLIPVEVGQKRYGGVVFWVDPTDNTHGLVCALSDYPSFREWGCFGTDLPSVPNVTSGPSGLGAEIGDGMSNTTNILNDCPTAPAALAARSYGSEWFLPSIKELKEMYDNKATLEAVAGFTTFGNGYWSSTESSNNLAWYQSFLSGSQGSQDATDKFYTPYVRAVRAF